MSSMFTTASWDKVKGCSGSDMEASKSIYDALVVVEGVLVIVSRVNYHIFLAHQSSHAPQTPHPSPLKPPAPPQSQRSVRCVY